MSEDNSNSDIKRNCPVCSCDRSISMFRPAHSPGRVVKCRDCGFIFVNPIESTKSLIFEGPVIGHRPARLLDSSDLKDIEGSWEQPLIERYMQELPGKRACALDVLQHIHGYLDHKGCLLDLGCFNGIFLSVASEAGWDCYGIEPMVMPAIYARAKFGLNVITGTLGKDTYPFEFFDVVTSFQVFEHLVYPERELENIRRVMKPHGLLVVEVPNIDTFIARLLGPRHRHFVEDHVSFFSARTLRLFLNRFGFRVIEVYYPERYMSVQHLVWWIGKLNTYIGKAINFTFPKSIAGRIVKVSLRDIVTIIAEKTDIDL